ncbi:hypothetical protein BDV96DRAFT_497562 [Lophiotrema nucula]|uniref:Uncharacterized protein n=1 Tax=Lophiotrema nucula TaxID=690887 RepID=A0A6A5Z0M0_9PLEO|nr:hypothetical protein BDV96DRAFT_497562 [Lophiotrema nucula]
MSFYPQDPSWPAPGRQSSWEQPQPPSRSGMQTAKQRHSGASCNSPAGASSTVNADHALAFAAQFEEVDRAAENLMKSGKFGFPPMANSNRRDSMPVMGGPPRPYPELNMADQRMGSGPQRHHSVSEYDGSRSHSTSNVQGYYQQQRYAPRPNDADQMAQAKRRMAAQRERELRNYHQEQQYHRNVSGSKSDRSMSPNMSEDDRRELIARQHRALYGENSSLYTSNNNPTSSQDVRVNSAGAGRGPSPLAFDPFGMQKGPNEGAVQMPSRDKDTTGGAHEARANSNSSPSSNQNPTFSLFDNAQQASRTSNSSPGGSPPRQGGKSNGSSVAPIGTRPTANQGQPAGAALNKRSTTPLPSPLSYHTYNASEQNHGNANTTSASLNPSSTATDNNMGGNIWNKSGVWGNANTHGVQASVWG